jgi:bifunctional non-homologous end joining protein LigD
MLWRSAHDHRLLPAGFIPPCLPTVAARPPADPSCIHEISHDGHRVIVRRAGSRVRLYTRRGYDWSGRFPAIEGAIAALKSTRLLIDGEAVHCRPDGVSDFNALHSRRLDANQTGACVQEILASQSALMA